MRTTKLGFGVVVLALTLGACKDKAKDDEGRTSGVTNTSSTAKAAASAVAAPSWVDNVTGEKFRAWIDGRPGGCDCTVTNFKKDGKISVISWQIHNPGESYFTSFVTTVSDHAGKEEGQKLAYSLTTKFKSCVRSDVGNKVIVSTRCVLRSTTAMYPNGKHEVKECRDEGASIPSGMEQYFSS